MTFKLETISAIREYLTTETEKLSAEANEQEVRNDLDALRIRAIYAEHFAKIVARSLYQLLEILDKETPNGSR